MSGICVYYLLDPQNFSPRYVGVAKNPTSRLLDHLKSRATTYKGRWIAKLAAGGLQPIMRVQCIVESDAEAKRLEVLLIANLRTQGYDLTNTSTGGDGGDTFTYADPIVQERRRLRASQCALGNQYGVSSRDERQRATYRASWTPERRAAFSAHMKIQMKGNTNAKGCLGTMRSEEIKQRQSAAWTLERRANTSARMQGNNCSLGTNITEETRQNLKNSWTPERRAKMSERMRGNINASRGGRR